MYPLCCFLFVTEHSRLLESRVAVNRLSLSVHKFSPLLQFAQPVWFVLWCSIVRGPLLMGANISACGLFARWVGKKDGVILHTHTHTELARVGSGRLGWGYWVLHKNCTAWLARFQSEQEIYQKQKSDIWHSDQTLSLFVIWSSHAQQRK